MNNSKPKPIVNTLTGIILVLFASLVAPKLPSQYTKKLKDPIVRFSIYLLIAYIGTKDLLTAIIAVVAVMIAHQSLVMNDLTDNVMTKTKEIVSGMDKDQIINGLNKLNENVLNKLAELPMGPYSQEPSMASEDHNLGLGLQTGADERHVTFSEPIISAETSPPLLSKLKDSITKFVDTIRTEQPEIKDEQIVQSLAAQNPQLDVNIINQCVAETTSLKMDIGDNTVDYAKGNEVALKKQKQLLQDNGNDIYFDLVESDALYLDSNNKPLTEQCSSAHKNNFAPNASIPPLFEFPGDDCGFETYGTI